MGPASGAQLVPEIIPRRQWIFTGDVVRRHRSRPSREER
jgi:hypothetical protein